MPGMGDVQQKVFEEMGPYDIFVGIFWKRFGTPTSEHESGSEAEFRDAYAKDGRRITAGPSSCTSASGRPITMSSLACRRKNLLNLDGQAQKVKAFREEIAGKGLYATYKELDEFKDKLRAASLPPPSPG